ncbi:cysteine hydrolase family protein [Dyella sp. BiH032]|uniref:cysteine hydrolase family protein n=1 Tax=Dyella sp. BiH032 TaxID=3075430 RepID=UPI002892B083|nr:cysteine hydrolase family protein [Dyella sp. BiH032]WNL44912.1 cysteine hydrolase family protein [Dyella sp. BiH032]
MTSALLVIDMQQALCAGEWAAHDIGRVLQRVNGLIDRARAAWVPVVLIQHEEAEGDLVFGTPGWQLAEGLHQQPDDPRVRKTTPDSFYETELSQLLQQHGTDHLVICGLQSDFCIDTTVRRALALGYHVTLAGDAHSTVDNDVLAAAQITAHHNWVLERLQTFGTRMAVVDANDVRFAG